jgi:plastocyanin
MDTNHGHQLARTRLGARALLAGSAVILSAGLAACGSASSSGTPGATHAGGGATRSTIDIKNFAFAPDVITVTPGATVSVTNEDSVTHTLTSTAGKFDTGDVASGHTARFTAPTTPGTYPYRCNIHQYMTGMLVVRAS